jgi:branched-chain amino acid transport system substrate-binding protein
VADIGFSRPRESHRRRGLTTRLPALGAAALATLMLAVAGCGGGDDDNAASTNSSSSAATSTPTTSDSSSSTTASLSDMQSAKDIKRCDNPAETVKVGALFELSGPLVAIGQASLEGVQMAVDEINDGGGFDVGGKCVNLSLSKKDNRSDAAATVAAARGLVQDEKVQYVFGPSSGLTAQKAQQVTQATDPPAIEFSSGILWESTGLLGQDSKRGLFRSALGQAASSQAFLDGLKAAQPDAKTIYFLWRDDDSTTATLESLKPLAEKAGYEVVGDDRFPIDSTDFSSALGKVRAAHPDVLSVGYVPADITAITRQATQLGIPSTIFSWNGAVSIPLKEAAGKPIPQPFVAGYQAPQLDDPQTPELVDFSKRYQAKFNHELNAASNDALWYYDEVYMTVKAMQDAKTTTDTDAVGDALGKLHWNGALGPICWTSKNGIVYGTDTALVKDGKVTWKHIPINTSLCG